MMDNSQIAMIQLATPADREPLPAGHPVTWGLLTDGTVLEGAPYDYRPPYPLLPMLARFVGDRAA